MIDDSIDLTGKAISAEAPDDEWDNQEASFDHPGGVGGHLLQERQKVLVGGARLVTKADCPVSRASHE